MAARKSIADRFWSKVDVRGPDECWPWKAGRYRAGYGTFSNARTTVTTHRQAWVLMNGPIPQGMCVCHRCDNPPCVNPGHLFLGTPLDNMRDMIAKGRRRVGAPSKLRGEDHPRSKLTDTEVREIRAWREAGFPGTQIAIAYGVTHSTVNRIASRRRWTHLR